MFEHLETPAIAGAASIVGVAVFKSLDFLTAYIKTKSNGGGNGDGRGAKKNGVCLQHPELMFEVRGIKADVSEIRKGMEKIGDELFSRVGQAEKLIAVVNDRTQRG